MDEIETTFIGGTEIFVLKGKLTAAHREPQGEMSNEDP